MLFYLCNLWQRLHRMKMFSWHRKKSVDYLLLLEYCPSLSSICKLTSFHFVKSNENLPCLIWKNHRSIIGGCTNSEVNSFYFTCNSLWMLTREVGSWNWQAKECFFTPKELALQNAASQGKQGVIKGKKKTGACWKYHVVIEQCMAISEFGLFYFGSLRLLRS